MSKITLDAFFDRPYSAAKRLKEALETNMEALGDDLDPETKELLMRVNLIAIRNCLQDYGDDA